MPPITHSGRTGRFIPTPPLVAADLYRACGLEAPHPGDKEHILPPPTHRRLYGTKVGPWKLWARQVHGLTAFFSPVQMLHIRVILWTLHHGAPPAAPLRAGCSNRLCINPKHAREQMPLDPKLIHYFTKATHAALAGDPLPLRFKTEKEAVACRMRAYTWRRTGLADGTIPEDSSHLEMRVIRVADDPDRKPFHLILTLASYNIDEALDDALGTDDRSPIDILRDTIDHPQTSEPKE